MSKLIAIGELLIDFTGQTSGSIDSVSMFQKNPGGAPANVACQVAKLGGEAMMITKLGCDGFGEYLVKVLQENHVDTHAVQFSAEANTGLAFVALTEQGERSFVFYRNPASDMLLDAKELDLNDFQAGDILHFCSVDLVPCPARFAHDKAIAYALARKLIISFDPNLRFALWPDPNLLKKTVWQYLPFAHIVKVGEEEVQFLCGGTSAADVRKLFVGNVEIVIVTKGSEGAQLFTSKDFIRVRGLSVKVVDTTGAGDAFIGAFLATLLQKHTTIRDLVKPAAMFREALVFANRVAAKVVTKYGAIPALPSKEDMLHDSN